MRNNNPTSRSTFQDLLCFQFPSVRHITVIQLMPLPCTIHHVSADHICTSTRCSLRVAKGQSLQKAPARGGQTHCPSATKDHFYLHICVPMTSYVSAAHGSTGILAEPQEVAKPQNIDCPHSSEGLWCFPTGHCFSNCLKCDTCKRDALILLLHLHAPVCLVPLSQQSWQLAHIQLLL